MRPDSFKDYTIPMLEEVFGTAGRLREMRVSGMTDLQIVGEALRDEGITHDHIRARVHEVRDKYMTAMRTVTGNGVQYFELLPGVRETLTAVAEHPRYHSALMTGNIEPAAHLKMELVGLSQFFTLPGAFGDESHDRQRIGRWQPTASANTENGSPGTVYRHRRHPGDIACAPLWRLRPGRRHQSHV